MTTIQPAAATCPPWCSGDLDCRNGRHAGHLELRDADVYLFQMSGEGFSVRLSGPDGDVDLSKITDIHKVGAIFTKLAAALTAAAN